jgi:cell shape-determining protein MreC
MSFNVFWKLRKEFRNFCDELECVMKFSRCKRQGKMKFLFLFLVFIFVNGLTFAAGISTPTTSDFIPKTSTDKLNLRIREQIAQVQRELKLGKVTQSQANSLRAQVQVIRQAEMADLKQNNNKTLTDAQLSDLNGQLNILSKSIPR